MKLRRLSLRLRGLVDDYGFLVAVAGVFLVTSGLVFDFRSLYLWIGLKPGIGVILRNDEITVAASGVSLILAAVVGYLYPLSETESDWLSYINTLDEYDDLVVSAHLPDDAFDEPVSRVESLEDLIGIALSQRSVVIEDETDRYFVRGDGVVYVYDPPPEP
ncbi:DUF5305 family protein [Halorutilales archaeon Cl-col2-1]